jgi:hypothetical protein
LTPLEKSLMLMTCHRPDFASLPPSQIVPRLMDEEGRYLASESSFYRVLREHSEHHRRDRTAHGAPKGPPRRHEAKGPNAVWTWDVTYCVPGVRGVHGCTNGPRVNLECAANSAGGH